MCSCPIDRQGHRCQYQNRCDNESLCADDTCVETVVNMDGYVCDSTPDNMAVILTPSNDVTQDQLDEALYDLVRIHQLPRATQYNYIMFL